MREWQEFAPVVGWASFSDSIALTNALRSRLPETNWHYLNFTTGSSVWESCEDTSMVRVHYKGEQLVEFAVQFGFARESVEPLISHFQLVPVHSSAEPSHAPEPAAEPDSNGESSPPAR